MAIPNTARTNMLSGVLGTLSHDGPTRVSTAVIKSVSEANNVFGRAATYADSSKETVKTDGSGTVFAGIIINPNVWKVDTATVRNGSVVELAVMGEVFVEVEIGKATSGGTDVPLAVGGKVWYDKTDGKLYSGGFKGTTALDAIVGAAIVRHTPNQKLAQVSLTGLQQA